MNWQPVPMSDVPDLRLGEYYYVDLPHDDGVHLLFQFYKRISQSADQASFLLIAEQLVLYDGMDDVNTVAIHAPVFLATPSVTKQCNYVMLDSTGSASWPCDEHISLCLIPFQSRFAYDVVASVFTEECQGMQRMQERNGMLKDELAVRCSDRR